MTLITKINMKDMLSQGLYILMLEKPFDKITIKQICDKTGVIRGTFYNHFIDKYEALEYLTHKLIIDDFVDDSDDKEHYIKLLKHIIIVINDHKAFFFKAFQVQGQNSFEEMLKKIFMEIFFMYFDDKSLDLPNVIITKEFLAAYQSAALVFLINDWVEHNCILTCDELYDICYYLVTKSFYEILYTDS